MINFSVPDAIILDMDGVLVNTEPIHMESFRLFLDELGVDYTEEFLRSLIGYSVDENIKTINRVYLQGSEISVNQGINRRDEIYLQLINKIQLSTIPGIPELIDYCYNYGIRMALASSSVRSQIDAVLENLSHHPDHAFRLSDFFTTIIAGDDVQNKKPGPDIYINALKALNMRAENCLAIEDSIAGVRSAKAAGIKCLALKNIFHRSADLIVYADEIIDSVMDVVDWLTRTN
ncbi:MAG: HAD family hydrolase [Calditrichaceae bacterium]